MSQAENSNIDNDGEVEPEVVILEEEAGNFQSSSWGGEEKEGYTFKGKKRQFGQASLEIQRLFFTNKEYNLDGVKFSLAKKTKEEKGSGLTYLLDIEKNYEKGSAVLKTWNKNSRNEYKMVVTKSKNSDLSFVKILSEVVKVLLEKNISGEGWSKMTTKNIIECKNCGKFYSSERYLKAHATKMHGINKEGIHAPKPCTICNKIFKTEVILKSHSVLCKRQQDIKRKRKIPGTPSKLVIEENNEQLITCDKCNLKFQTKSEISKHLESEHSAQDRVCSICDMKFANMSALEWIKRKHEHENSDCCKKKRSVEVKEYVYELCDFKSQIEANVKNHMSDTHATGAKYVTPPPKKRKKETDDEKDDQMDIDEDMFSKIEKLSISDPKDQEQEECKRLSDLMDKKVIEKQKKFEEDELLYEQKKKDDEEKKRKREQEIILKEKKTRNCPKLKKIHGEENQKALPNSIVIDPKYHSLVGDNNVKYKSPMDGTCQVTAKAAILFQDPTKGPELAAQENKYLVAHWDYFKNTITFPHTIKVHGGNIIVFQNETDFHEYLLGNPQSNYMWGDHQHLQITANRYNVRINVLSINLQGEASIFKEPIMPDPRLNEFAMLAAHKTEIKDMWLMYSNGNHYDALIAQDHPLLTMGTIAEMATIEQVEEKGDDEHEDTILDRHTDKDKLIKELKSQLKLKDQSKLQVEGLYRKAEETIKVLEEDNTRLKINVKDLNEYITRKEYSEKESEKNNVQTKKVCKFIWSEIIKVSNKDKETMYNCDQCSFQATKSVTLSKHLNTKHRTAEEQTNDVFRCLECDLQFSTKWNLMNHKTEMHEITDICEYFLKGTCRFNPPKKCWALHKKPTSPLKEKEAIICYVCKERFRTRNGMMQHRKLKHIEVVPECREFSLGNCDFTDNEKECWYKHKNTTQTQEEQNFQKVTENLAPPSKK